MAVWKLILVANRARRGWKRIPPEQRRRIMEKAGRGVRTHGPIVARRIGTAVQKARKAR
jgi:acyl-CoA reductase-like NAD-dependent aldehyde dehydrogenase